VWRNTSAAKRADIILRAARLIRERVEDISVTMTLEQGKRLLRLGLKSCVAATLPNGMRLP